MAIYYRYESAYFPAPYADNQLPLRPESEFLSDAPFVGLSLSAEFQLANCACASGWSCLMNLDPQESKFHLSMVAEKCNV